MRLVVISNLAVDGRMHWQVLAPPVEERLAAYPEATVVRPPALRRPTLRRDLPAWLAAARTVRRADAVFWFQMSSRPPAPLWALAYANPRARRSTWVIDSWEPVIERIGRIAAAQRIGPLFVSFRQSHAALRAAFPRLDARWLPFAANPAVFRPDGDGERDVFAYWMGRRTARLHDALEAYCRERGLVYRTDAVSGPALGELVARSRYFVVTPPDVDDPARTGSFSPMTSRYFEGPAAGARLLGTLPRSGEFEALLPREAALEVPPDGTGLAEALDRDAERWDDAQAAVRRARREVHEHHTWQRRAEVIYSALSEPAPPTR